MASVSGAPRGRRPGATPRGWGNPLDRDPQAVLDDVLDEYVSVEGAVRDYSVVLTGSLEDLTLAIDPEATEKLRASRRT